MIPNIFRSCFSSFWFGLFISDIWKYWIGYSAHASARARKWADNDKVMALQDKVKNNALTDVADRQILTFGAHTGYVACGYFKMSYAKFCAIIFLSAFIYCAVIFRRDPPIGRGLWGRDGRRDGHRGLRVDFGDWAAFLHIRGR